ncbi:patatin-like phospholipase family protein [Neptunomonas sp.]|uniref:patatin-like phospholipase family protein n=1 Tax=Neptunomonas sp. TaxID=1971898 RepID=UPI0025CE44EE|nr:patatin-like phospholipase family protein [Neptunomonas sp.]
MTSYTKDISDIIDQESAHIGKEANQKRIGLSFSGGGIRSASFSMGVLQALVSDKQLEKMDYLSTVSGGGYLGASLTWFLSQKTDDGEHYGTQPDNFPFGRKREGGKHNNKNAILDFIRQHGNYLIPGHGLSPQSLVATILRTMLVSLAIYFAMATSIMNIALYAVPEKKLFTSCLYALAVLATLWITTSTFYSLYSFFKGARYQFSVFIQKWLGRLINVMIILLVIGSMPYIHDNVSIIAKLVMAVEESSDIASNIVGASTASIAMIIGAILTLFYQRKQMYSTGQGTSSFQIIFGAILLLFGLLYGAYVAALYVNLHNEELIYPIAVGSLLFGLVCNVNFFGLNYMYRNRLMETFMPDQDSLNTGRWGLALKANKGKVQNMCQAPNQRPYHLINCNIVLTDSHNAKYRGRKGDSFTISPLYCGSDATGWRQTKDYMYNTFRSGLSLPTAMAISGAAANPNAGVAGKGITTNQFVSTLMSLLNLRLGFWAENPKMDKTWLPPNYIYPGIKGGVSLSSGLHEDDRAIELSDGGHFENLAIYELFRRRLDLIVVADAGADGEYQFSDLANAIEKVRVDFGINTIFLDEYPFEAIIPDSDTTQSEINKQQYHFAKRCFAIAKIEYPKEDHEEERKIGHLIYIKPTLINGLSPDVLSYKKLHPTFPHQSTVDQFFTEQQFEAYRELGYYLGWQMLNDKKIQNLL